MEGVAGISSSLSVMTSAAPASGSLVLISSVPASFSSSSAFGSVLSSKSEVPVSWSAFWSVWVIPACAISPSALSFSFSRLASDGLAIGAAPASSTASLTASFA